jgi:hypothetical protein
MQSVLAYEAAKVHPKAEVEKVKNSRTCMKNSINAFFFTKRNTPSSLLYGSQTFPFRKKPFTQGSLHVTGEKRPLVDPKRLLYDEC